MKAVFYVTVFLDFVLQSVKSQLEWDSWKLERENCFASSS